MQSQKNVQFPLPVQPLPLAPNSPTLLLVEDEPSVLKATRRMLEHLGYHVLTANQGEGALAIYEAQQTDIDLILTDLTLPGLSGMELAEMIWKKNPRAKIVALTGHAFDRERVEASNQYVVDWVQKPFDLQGLAGIIKRWLASSRDPQQTSLIKS